MAACVAVTGAVHAEAYPASEAELAAQLTSLPSGDQLLLEQRHGTVNFAGQELELDGMSGIAGYGSQMAYLVVVEGEAKLGDLSATAGRMIIIPPLGDKPQVQRFDAARLHEALGSQPAASGAEVTAKLATLAHTQGRGVWLGRLARTSFNVATIGPDGAKGELARRSLLDNAPVRTLRFGASNDPVAVERAMVSTFANGLRGGDVETVASLLDPLPFGGLDLRGGAQAARALAARQILDRSNWQATLTNGAIPLSGEPGNWRITIPQGAVVIATRPAGEFVFVKSVTFEPANPGEAR